MLLRNEKVSQSISTVAVVVEIIIKGPVTCIEGMARNPHQVMAQASHVSKMSFDKADIGT